MATESEASKSFDRRVGDRIRRLREFANMTQQELADALTAAGWGIGATSVTKIEKGTRALRVNELALLAKALECSLTDLMPFEDVRIMEWHSNLVEHTLDARAALRNALPALQMLQHHVLDVGAEAVLKAAGVDLGGSDVVEYLGSRRLVDDPPRFEIWVRGADAKERYEDMLRRYFALVCEGLAEVHEVAEMDDDRGVDPEA